MQVGQKLVCKVLVVEDHLDTAFLLARFLRAEGHTVTVANGYVDALRAGEDERFDVIVCDIGLPDGDGCDLIRELRSRYPLRAVAVTGYGEHVHSKRCKDAGFERFLSKPFSLDALADAIQTLCVEARPLSDL
jgi:CheY-like chemotaxis protein